MEKEVDRLFTGRRVTSEMSEESPLSRRSRAIHTISKKSTLLSTRQSANNSMLTMASQRGSPENKKKVLSSYYSIKK